MLQLSIPSRGELEITHLVLDYNGTIAEDGTLVEGIQGYLASLRDIVKVVVLTADTFGTIKIMAEKWGFDYKILGNDPEFVDLPEDVEKAAYINKIGAKNVIAVGNGTNDALMLRAAAIGIGVIGKEGISRECLEAADIIVRAPIDALDLVLHPKRMVATLRR